jgi:hypothetical protein
MATDTTLLDPQTQFLGCLMQLPHAPARRLAAGMSAEDFADPMAAHVAQLAIEILADGHDPAPVVLYTRAITTGRAAGESYRARLGGWLTDAYRDAPPPAVAGHLKTVLLEAAWRRAVTEHAHRVLQAAESADTALLRQLADDTGRADDLWTRYRASDERDRDSRPGLTAA